MTKGKGRRMFQNRRGKPRIPTALEAVRQLTENVNGRVLWRLVPMVYAWPSGKQPRYYALRGKAIRGSAEDLDQVVVGLEGARKALAASPGLTLGKQAWHFEDEGWVRKGFTNDIRRYAPQMLALIRGMQKRAGRFDRIHIDRLFKTMGIQGGDTSDKETDGPPEHQAEARGSAGVDAAGRSSGSADHDISQDDSD